MNDLTVMPSNLPAVKAKGGILAETAAELVGLERTGALTSKHFRGLHFNLSCSHEEIAAPRQAVEQAQKYVYSTEFAENKTRLGRATELAPEDIIARELKFFLGSWPNTARADLAAFGAMLAVDVRNAAPSRYAVMEACRQLRTTAKFLPTIAEVLEAIRDAEGHIHRVAELHHLLPERVEGGAKQIAAWDQQQEESKAYRERRLEKEK